MLTGSITLGRLAGAPLRIHWSAGVVAAILAAMLLPAYGVLGAAVIAGLLLRRLLPG